MYKRCDYMDYEDRFCGVTKSGLGVDELFRRMFEDFPAPVKWLLKLRDALVRPFGLKTGTGFADKILERNALGRLYFAAIWCFHKIIVWGMFSRAINGMNSVDG